MEWFLKVVRIAGASFPGASSLVQLQSELDSNQFKMRMDRLEDPISYLHEDLPDLARAIYKEMKANDSVNLNFPNEFYTQFSRPLAALDSVGLITKNSIIGSPIPMGINLVDPSFIMYMCNLAEDGEKMQELIDIVDRCEIGISLNGDDLKHSIGIPRYVIRAVFEIYAEKGYGFLSREIGSCEYIGKA